MGLTYARKLVRFLILTVIMLQCLFCTVLLSAPVAVALDEVICVAVHAR